MGNVLQRSAPQQQAAPQAWVNPWDAQIAAQLERMNGTQRQPMYSPEEVQQRRETNQREYEVGLLGALSGMESLQSAGGTVLKNALAQRQPKVTERGVADPLSGNFTYDPEYLQEREAGKLDNIQRLKTAADVKHESDAQAQQSRADMQADRLENTRALRQITAAGAAGGVGAGDARKFTVEDRMFDDYTRETKTHRQVMDIFKNLGATAQRADAASDMAFIFQYMKMLDPGSVVREGEFASAQNAAGVPGRIINMYNRARTGNFLNAQQRADMLGTAGRLAGQADAAVNAATQSYSARAMQRGIDPYAVTGVRPQAPAGAQPAAPRAPARAAPQPGGLPPGWQVIKE